MWLCENVATCEIEKKKKIKRILGKKSVAMAMLMYKIISGLAVMISSPEKIEDKWKNWQNPKLGQTPSSFFFFCLRAHNQCVDYSGAYNWGCLLLY